MDKSIIFIGFAVSDDIIKDCIIIDRYPQIAANKFQWNIINSIENYSGVTIDLISAIPATNFPGNKKIIFKKCNWSHRDNSSDIILPFVNIIILKHITRFLSFTYCLWKKMKGEINKNKYIIMIYSLHSPFMAASLIIRGYIGAKIILIIPDMPSYMAPMERTSIIRRLAKTIDEMILVRMIKKMDGLIVLTKYMAENYSREIPTMVMEGMISLSQIQAAEETEKRISRNSKERIIMYSGSLTGIRLLLEAFSLIQDPTYRLWISGRGEMEGEIKSAAVHDKRIIYLGMISNDNLLEKQLQTSVLVNVRSAKTPFIQYSFPSKILEYMAVGRPIITTALHGIPDEYHEYIYLLREETPEALAALFTNVCSKPREELDRIGRRAREFVRDKKNQVHQGERICHFMGSL